MSKPDLIEPLKINIPLLDGGCKTFANIEEAKEWARKESLRPDDDPSKKAVKFDLGKTRHDLVPVEGVIAVATILGDGAKKYGDRNWEQGMDWSRCYSAALRHLYAWWGGEDTDSDSGRNHLWHACTNIFFLIVYSKRSLGRDDRPGVDHAV